jgi:transposase
MDKSFEAPLLGWQVEDEITAQLETMQVKLDEQATRIDEQAALITKQAALIKYYEGQFLLLKRRMFGASSERTLIGDNSQLSLFDINPTDEPPKPFAEPETEDISYKRKKRKGKRDDDLAGLPACRIDHELPEDKRGCPECDEPMADIGVDVRRELKLIPAQVVVVEHATHAYACRNKECEEVGEGTVIVKADAPAPLLSGSLASPSLVAHIAVQKYAGGMPLYRIEKGFQYDGVVISRQNMASWVIKCAELYLVAIYMLLKSFLLKETALHADGTTVQVLREPGRAAQTKSCQWVYRTSGHSEQKIVIYDYQQTKEQRHPQEFFKEYNGFLHTDGEQAYHNLPPDIIVVGCWAHVRRRFENTLKSIPKENRKDTDAERGVAFINRLFALEREFKDLSPEDRYRLRLEKSKSVADEFFIWVENLNALPKSLLGQAAHYVLTQRKYLENIYLDGRLELSNNRCERSVKPFVMGRKAWLFCTTPEGATASSIMYSIIETAKENGLHPFHYIKYLLETLPNSTTENLETLLPWSYSIPDFCKIPIV